MYNVGQKLRPLEVISIGWHCCNIDWQHQLNVMKYNHWNVTKLTLRVHWLMQCCKMHAILQDACNVAKCMQCCKMHAMQQDAYTLTPITGLQNESNTMRKKWYSTDCHPSHAHISAIVHQIVHVPHSTGIIRIGLRFPPLFTLNGNESKKKYY